MNSATYRQIIGTYLKRVSQIRETGEAVAETSYDGALEQLLGDIGVSPTLEY
jgi:hypothetical protein